MTMNRDPSRRGAASNSQVPAAREALLAGERARLREIQIQVRQDVLRLKHPEHLQAALNFGELYREATGRRRGSRNEFEDKMRAELGDEEPERDHVQVQKWKLPASIAAIDDKVRKKYLRSSEPQKSLRHYLAGVRAAADMLGRDREAEQIAFLKKQPLWREGVRIDAPEEVRDAADRLCRMLDAMCRAVARDLDLMTTFQRLDSQRMRWLPFEGRVEATDGHWMDGPFSPVYPVCDIGTHVSEMRPFPSVPLVRIPMGWVEGELLIEEGKGASDQTFGGARREGTFKARPGRLIQYREIRLTIAPLNDREVGSVLLSQDSLGWRNAEDRLATPVIRIVSDGSWSDLRNDSRTGPKTAPVWSWKPEAEFSDGWRRIALHCDESLTHASPDYLDEDDWEWDPIERPGEVMHLGRGYVSATRLTPDHLYHWLFCQREVAGEGEVCPWDDSAHSGDIAKPPQLTAPLFTAARTIEACIHEGTLEAELRRQAVDIVRQVADIVTDGRRAADAAESKLMARWARPEDGS